MQSLFPHAQNINQHNELVSFKAGKCTLEPKPNGLFLVTADVRKGKISLVKKDDLLHFQWLSRLTGEIEDDRIIFPHEATFKRVKTGRDNDRVYLLNLTGNQRFMYWFQDKESSKDKETVDKINELFSNGISSSSAAPATNGFDLSSILGALSSGNTVSSQPPSETSATSSSAITNAFLQNSLAQSQQMPTNLADVLSPDNVINSGLLDDPNVRNELIEHLPEGQRSEEFLEDNIRSPQFQQSLMSLSEALQTDGGSGVIASFGLNPNDGMDELNQGNIVSAFLSSIQASANSQISVQSQVVENTSAEENTNDTPDINDRMEE